MTTFTLKVEGCPPLTGLNRRELDALIKTARQFRLPGRVDSGPRIDTIREETK